MPDTENQETAAVLPGPAGLEAPASPAAPPTVASALPTAGPLASMANPPAAWLLTGLPVGIRVDSRDVMVPHPETGAYEPKSEVVFLVPQGSEPIAYQAIIRALNTAYSTWLRSHTPVMTGARGNGTAPGASSAARGGVAPTRAPNPVVPAGASRRPAPAVVPNLPGPAASGPMATPAVVPPATNRGLSMERRGGPPPPSRVGHPSSSLARRGQGPVPNVGPERPRMVVERPTTAPAVHATEEEAETQEAGETAE